jgi:protein N-terminal glutamine amidohydrolase
MRVPLNHEDKVFHQPFWCEENIWHLAQHPAAAADERLVLVITGVSDQVACWHQKAGEVGAPVLWDYHVVLAARARDAEWQIWDLDSRVGFPVAAETWLRSTFPRPEAVPARFQPRFGVFAAEEFVERFGSDRSHMRDASGKWLQAPPPWGAIAGRGLSLSQAVGQARAGLDLAGLRARLR